MWDKMVNVDKTITLKQNRQNLKLYIYGFQVLFNRSPLLLLIEFGLMITIYRSWLRRIDRMPQNRMSEMISTYYGPCWRINFFLRGDWCLLQFSGGVCRENWNNYKNIILVFLLLNIVNKHIIFTNNWKALGYGLNNNQKLLLT